MSDCGVRHQEPCEGTGPAERLAQQEVVDELLALRGEDET